MWNDRYSVDEYVYGQEPNEFLEKHYEAIPQGPVLCLAEGEGRNAVFLARQGYQVTAVDSSDVGLTKAKKLALEHGVEVETIVADLKDFIIEPGQWSGIVSIFCHLPPELRTMVHKQIPQGLKPGGIFLLEAYTPDQLQYGTGGPPVSDLMMSEGILSEELEALEFSLLQEVEREVHEGQLHTGLASVVQAIGMRG